MVTEKEKALELAVGHIEKQFGKGSIMKLGEAFNKPAVEAIPSGSLALDIALGVGEFPEEGLQKYSVPRGLEKPHWVSI